MEVRLRYLFARYLDNSCSQIELEEFFSYIRESEHDELLRELIKDVYIELQGAKSRATFVDEKGRLVLTEPSKTATKLPVVKRRKVKTIAGMLTRALMIIIIGGIWLFINQGKTSRDKMTTISALTTKTTSRSEIKTLLLKDSTQVWLNAASSLEFPDDFAADKREVFLAGEAFFDVKHADKIPFIIHTGNVSTTVLGTAFSIKAYTGQQNITISVTRGKVKVSNQQGWVATLVKGEQIKLASAGEVTIEKNIPLTSVAAWQQGNMVYDDETLQDIIADLERVYNVTIHLADASTGGLKISTSFKKEIGIQQALLVLCKLTDTDLKKTQDVYILQ